MKKWLDANRLVLNIDKTNFVVFHPPHIKIPKPVIIRFGGKKIKCESCVKFLSILLDEYLSWKFHMNELSKELSRAVGIFYKIRHFCPSDILWILCYSLFYSFLSHGISVWGFTFKSYFEKLSFVQKKTVKVMTFNKQTASSAPIFSNLEFLKTDDIHQFQLLSFVYDCQNKLAPAYSHKFFVWCAQIHSYSTKLASCGDLFLGRKNTFQYGIRSIEYNGDRLWNMVPAHTRELPSPSVFWSSLKKHFLNIRITPYWDHDFMGNSVSGHSNLSFLYQIHMTWWGLIELESLLPFFSSANININSILFSVFWWFLCLTLIFCDSKNYNFIPSRRT